MNLEALIAAVRADADDLEEPYLFGEDEQIVGWLNEAEEEACIRKSLIFESALASMCEISVMAEQQSYLLDERWITITKAYLTQEGSDCVIHLSLTSREEMDRTRSNWRTEARDPAELIQYDTRVEFASPIAADFTLHLEGHRLPLEPMEDGEDKPEIGRSHHAYLRHWALHRGYSVPDSEVFNPDKAAKAERAFAAYFGERPDADLRKTQQQDVPHHNLAVWVMNEPTNLDLVIRGSSTFTQVLRVELGEYVTAAIAAIALSNPISIETDQAHGLVDGWRVAVVDAVGAIDPDKLVVLNAKKNPPEDSDYRRATVVDATHIEFNGISSAGFEAHQAGTGYLQWLTPKDLAGFIARMSIKAKAADTEVLLSLTTENSRIVIDNTAKTITLQLSATVTAALTWTKGVYDLELESPTGEVTAIFAGSVTVSNEVTT